jgi:glycosyltransferase 2 family protein
MPDRHPIREDLAAPEARLVPPSGDPGPEDLPPVADTGPGDGPEPEPASESGLRARARKLAKAGVPLARSALTSRTVRYGFCLAAVGLGGYAVAREWPGVQSSLAKIGVPTLAAALVCVLLAMVAAMQSWRLTLAALGSPLTIRVGSWVMFVGQLGKYVPGSVWAVLAQMELGTSHRVPRHHSASASVLSNLISLLSGLLTAAVTLPFVSGSDHYLWAFLAVPVLLGCLHPRVLNALLRRLFRLVRRPPLHQPLTLRAIAAPLAWSFGSWLFYGLQIWLLTIRLGAPAGTAALASLGGFALAWSVGFVAVFAPAGAGVREVVLTALLGPVVGVGAATAIALVARALTTVGDLLAASAAAAYFRRTRDGRSAGPAQESRTAPGP